MRHIHAILCAGEDIPNKNRKLTKTVELISIFLKALNVIQTLLATFCQHFIEFFILEFFFFEKIILSLINLSSNQMGVNLQNHKKCLSYCSLSA